MCFATVAARIGGRSACRVGIPRVVDDYAYFRVNPEPRNHEQP